MPLETENLARFSLPSVWQIEVGLQNGGPIQACPVLISYGYQLPPLRTDSEGRVRGTREMFEKAMEDEISTGLADHKGDYSLGRYVRVRVPSKSDAARIAESRRRSGWPLLRHESELYTTLDSLLMAYVPPLDIESAEQSLDLALHRCGAPAEVVLRVRLATASQHK